MKAWQTEGIKPFNSCSNMTTHYAFLQWCCKLAKVGKNNYLDNFIDLIFCYAAIFVHIIQGEGPLKFLNSLAGGGEMQRHNIFFKIERTVTVQVETSEHVLGVGLRVRIGKEPGIDALELLPADVAAWALFQEGPIPGVQLLFCVCSVGF